MALRPAAMALLAGGSCIVLLNLLERPLAQSAGYAVVLVPAAAVLQAALGAAVAVFATVAFVRGTRWALGVAATVAALLALWRLDGLLAWPQEPLAALWILQALVVGGVAGCAVGAVLAVVAWRSPQAPPAAESII